MFCKLSAIGCVFYIMTSLAAAQVSGSGAAQREQQQTPELSTIVQRMEQAANENRERYRAYVMIRDYQLYGGTEQKPSSEVTAEISFVPPTSKEFKITESTGSARGETVVRRILENERKDAETGKAPGAVTRANYDFTLLGRTVLDGHMCYVLGLAPKRKDKTLLEGRAWVDTDTYHVRRVQGMMSKLPSWWLKSVEVTLDFSNVGGMWLQTHTKATADVRIFGPHTLMARALTVRTGSTVAEIAPPRRAGRSLSRPAAGLGQFER